MSNMFRTEADVMRSAAGNVDQTNATVQGELKRLAGVVDTVRGSWAGNAQVSFDNLMVRYNESARDLRQALASIADNIRSNAAGFEDIEATNALAFSRVGAQGLAL